MNRVLPAIASEDHIWIPAFAGMTIIFIYRCKVADLFIAVEGTDK